MMRKINVVAAVIVKNGLYFCAQRNVNGTLPLLWEFPGGKIEDGETSINALEREIIEEFQASIKVIRYLTTSEYKYDFAHIVLHAYLCELEGQELKLVEHNDSLWLDIDQLKQLKWAPADIPIVEYIIKMKEKATSLKTKDIIFVLSNHFREIDKMTLWNKFHHFDFALYNKEKVFFSDGSVIEWDDRFIGNTAIKYKSSYIAIWNMDTIDSFDIDLLSASLIHEMFHAFQYEQQELRWPDEIDGLFYEYNSENLSIKLQEANILIELLEDFDKSKFDTFLRSRVYRLQNYPSQFDYETKIEVVEGMAEFVELEALKQLSIEKYNNRLENLKQLIRDPQEYIKIRMLSYHMGSLFLIVCKENDIDVEHDISLETKTIFELLIKHKDVEPLKLYKKDCFSQILEEKKIKEKEVFVSKQQMFTDVIQGPFEMVGFDPLNTIRVGDLLYCKHFIAYKDKEETVFFTKECLVKLKNKKEIENIRYLK